MKPTKLSLTAAAPDKRLEQLTDQIRAHAAGARLKALHRIRVGHAVGCGGALLQLKELLGRGRWKRWMEEQCGLNRMTANRYMRLSKQAHVLTPYMTIRDAYIAAGVIAPKRPAPRT